ncbi:UDP-N-acetylglucosamine 4-epimerase [Acaryochloris thomasi RCC1774]|uniref:UDP-N-acetylglucosamine 4-epimerase n=1 Tax=Acaryochloris thomasi RCC1774 TaxID=1764569 RepID=A0A2W1JUQ0_9CYAN|nr:NAD-dependent epimerase [Acaryochloris thomasi]PZD74212.1 UDP-N-acetylglucosamine 4-epimerase [Acaryochloris thomasi RCC1774]
MRKILVTGAAGFIGFHICQELLARDEAVIGLDNLNDYYDVGLKQARLDRLTIQKNFQFFRVDLAERTEIANLFSSCKPDLVIHLAAQAGVRHSLTHPHAYIDSNLVGFANILEGCRSIEVKHLIFASSSSVYGANTKIPFAVGDFVDHPVSLYAATKKANELMAFTYSHLYALPATGLRFFTVYGPWGRPDMAYFSFTRSILRGEPIKVFNYGKMRRDFTYIRDIVAGIVKILEKPPSYAGTDMKLGSESTIAPYKIYNIGNNQPIELLAFIEVLENCLGIEANKKLLPIQPGDMLETYADISELSHDIGFRPSTSIESGLRYFVDWYRSYYGV